MSADLFAEFEDLSSPKQGQPQARGSAAVPTALSFPGLVPVSSVLPLQPHSSQPWAASQPASQAATSLGPWASVGATTSAGTATQHTVTAGGGEEDEDDDEGWGDFETAQVPEAKPVQATDWVVGPAAMAPRQTPASPPEPRRIGIVRAPTFELIANAHNLIGVSGGDAGELDTVHSPPPPQPSFPWQQQSAPTRGPPSRQTTPSHPASNSNVLFDADEFDGEDDDEFGDFETVASPARAPPKPTSLNLLASPKTTVGSHSKNLSTLSNLSNLSLQEPTSPYPQAPRSPSFQERNPFPGLALNTPTKPEPVNQDAPTTSPITAWPELDHNSAFKKAPQDLWTAFEDLPESPKPPQANKVADDWAWDSFDAEKPTPPKSAKSPAGKKEADDSWAWDPEDVPGDDVKASVLDTQAPPINVPPPSVLLSIFPQLLAEANSALYKPVGGQPFSIKNRILSDPKTLEFLRGYLLLATVAARIAAGRKLRWHRDKFLTQSMSISTAGSKGMKLAGIDKTQATREDREAGDVIDICKAPGNCPIPLLIRTKIRTSYEDMTSRTAEPSSNIVR